MTREHGSVRKLSGPCLGFRDRGSPGLWQGGGCLQLTEMESATKSAAFVGQQDGKMRALAVFQDDADGVTVDLGHANVGNDRSCA